MESENFSYRKSDDPITGMGIGAVHFVEEWLKTHMITARSIERWDKVTEGAEPTLAYFKVFVSQDNDQVFPESFPESEVIMILEIHQ